MLGRKPSLREARHIDKVFFTGIDDLFYESVATHYRPSDELRTLVQAMLDERGLAWDIRRKDVWSHVRPVEHTAETQLPTQGWKIHVSANEQNCRDLLTKVATLALDHGMQFKFANDVNTLKLMTSKRWARGGSGKFITLYPRTDEEFRDFIELAYAILKDDVGSYILSDNRYKDCRCLYYRYGGIIQVNRLDYMGRKVPILTSPDGEEIIDYRTPYFDVPPWTTDPFPREDAEPADMTLMNGRFAIQSALAFSNTGGVYLATDTTTGEDVVIKEARPHVELGEHGQDATSRLAQEERMLSLVADLGISPRLVTTFWDWENFYLAEEHLDASDMREVMLMNSPLLKVNPTVEDSETFYRIHKSIFVSLLKAIDAIHGKGVIMGDLSPMNILVDKADMTVRIIDLESAYQPKSDEPQNIYTPGFRSEVKGRKKENDFHDDIYAIGAIMMYSMFPIVATAYVRNDLFTRMLPVLVADIGWANTPVEDVIRKLAENTITCREAIVLLDAPASFEQPYTARQVERELSSAVASSALARFMTDHCRLDDLHTLFPADPFGGQTNTLGLGFGATGIVQALHKCGCTLPAPARERFDREIAAAQASEIPPGFLTGSAGIAWSFFGMGNTEQGKRFMAHANASPLLRAHHSLYYGMAGIGMANLAAYLHTNDSTYLDAAKDLANSLASSAIEDERGLHWEDDGEIRIGYGYGQSGVALFFLRLSQVLKAPTWRALGQKALEYDLSFGFELETGITTFACSPEEKNTYEHYIEQGTGGIAKVAIRYGLWDRLESMFPDVYRKYSGFPGLIYGLTGFVDVLLDAYLYSGNRKYLAMAERPLQGIADLYLFKSGDGYAAPGENLFRISCDFATGIAGMMRTFHRHANRTPDEFCLDELDVRPSETHAAQRLEPMELD